MIAPKGTGESLFWDHCPQTDLFISYKLVENPTPKKIDGLIEKTYMVIQEAEKSSRISLFLGLTSIFITVVTVIIPQRKKIASSILNKLRKVWTIIKN